MNFFATLRARARTVTPGIRHCRRWIQDDRVAFFQVTANHLADGIRGGAQTYIDGNRLAILQNVDHPLPIQHTHGTVGHNQGILDLFDGDRHSSRHPRFDLFITVGYLYPHSKDDGARGCIAEKINLDHPALVGLALNSIELDRYRLVHGHAVDIHLRDSKVEVELGEIFNHQSAHAGRDDIPD